MTKEHDLNKTFVQMSGFFLLGGIAAAYYSGIGSIIVAGIVCYIMLVAVNSIKRGEMSKRHAKR